MTQPVWATNAIRCLGVVPGERVAVLVDESLIDAGLRVCDAAVTAGAGVSLIALPDSTRPIAVADASVVASLVGRSMRCCSGSGGRRRHPSSGRYRYPIYQSRAGDGRPHRVRRRESTSDTSTHEMSADYYVVPDALGGAGRAPSEDGSTCA